MSFMSRQQEVQHYVAQEPKTPEERRAYAAAIIDLHRANDSLIRDRDERRNEDYWTAMGLRGRVRSN
jgi:hypothetical protein